MVQLQKDHKAQEQEHKQVLGDLRKEANPKLGKGKDTLTANHHSLSNHVESLEKVNDALTKVNKEKTSLGNHLQEVTNSLQGEEDQANQLGKIKIRFETSLQESQEESESQKGQHVEVEKAEPGDTAQKEPNPAKSDGDATGTTLEEQTGKKMERRRKASYRDSESGKKDSNKRKGPYHEDESREKTAQRILKR